MDDIENGMVMDEYWQDKYSMSEEEWNEYVDYMDTLREEREGY